MNDGIGILYSDSEFMDLHVSGSLILAPPVCRNGTIFQYVPVPALDFGCGIPR
jgi:hypothetical protein